jgi:hypothetical protein
MVVGNGKKKEDRDERKLDHIELNQGLPQCQFIASILRDTNGSSDDAGLLYVRSDVGLSVLVTVASLDGWSLF